MCWGCPPRSRSLSLWCGAPGTCWFTGRHSRFGNWARAAGSSLAGRRGQRAHEHHRAAVRRTGSGRMTQNMYDNPDFFERYSQLPRSVEGLEGAPEWPVLRALLPDLRGRKVLDLGCGFGWFCRWARGQGASEVRGIDVSENMLARARVDTSDASITYVRADME